MGREVSRVAARCTLVLVVTGLVASIVWRLVAGTILDAADLVLTDRTAGSSGMEFDTALAVLCCLALLGCVAWLVLVTGLVAVEALGMATGQPFAARISSAGLCPGALRRLVLAGCGVALTAGLAGTPAWAHSARPASPADDPAPSALAGLPVPDRAVGTSGRAVAGVRISTGDCLWYVADRALPENAGNAEITAAWHAIHRANLDRIGVDPDLVLPGTLLLIPDLDPPPRKESS